MEIVGNVLAYAVTGVVLVGLALALWYFVQGLGFVRFGVLVATVLVVEFPAALWFHDASTCVARGEDLSCVSIADGGIFYQLIALPILVVVALVLWWRRR